MIQNNAFDIYSSHKKKSRFQEIGLRIFWGLCVSSLIMFNAASFAESVKDHAKAIVDNGGVAGGLIVHIGCGDGSLTKALSVNGRFLVQGLANDKSELDRARKTVKDAELYGGISIRLLEEERLPYADDMVNIIVNERPGTVAETELMRVLVPGGMLLTAHDDGWKKTIKPKSEQRDEWTHFLYDSSNNAVSKDNIVGPPKSLRWACGPEYSRSHEHLASVSAMVSGNGRVFYIIDEGPIADVYASAAWKLVARDAYNGVLLWEYPIGLWESQVRGFRSGPVDLARRLAVNGDRVYVTPSMGERVAVIDAMTGEERRRLKGSEGAREILIDKDMVIIVADNLTAEDHQQRRLWFEERAEKMTHYQYPRVPIKEFGVRRLIAYSEKSGKQLWEKEDNDTKDMLPAVTAVKSGVVCLHNYEHLICLERETGEEKWRSARQMPPSRVTWSAPTMVIANDVVLVGDRADLSPVKPGVGKDAWVVENSHKGKAKPAEVIAYDIEDGQQLWQAECFENYDCPFDILVLDDVVWTGKVLGTQDPGFVEGRDLHTGEIVARLESDLKYFVPGMGHHRCYRNKATERFLLTGRSGIEFIEPSTGRKIAHHWVRGSCQYGIMPANGLTIAPLHSCACHITGKLTGINALAAESNYPSEPEPNESRLEKGPTYGKQGKPASKNDWPMYRNDASRSGFLDVPLSHQVQLAWSTKVGESLTPPIVGDGKVFCADKRSHTVIALNQNNGDVMWEFITDGRIDSSPSYHQGRLVFGSSSGYVYCLDAETGMLGWKFRAAPTTAQIVSRGQLESLWPVHGSVLIKDNKAYFAAGRSSFLDGGILLYALDVATGEVLASRQFNSLDPQSGEQPKDIVISFNYDAPRVALPGIFSADGDDIFMRHLRFDSSFVSKELNKKHLYSSAGILDHTWWHRTYWQYGTKMGAGYHGWHLSGNETPAGRILVFDNQHVYGYGRKLYDKQQGGHMSEVGPDYHLFCEPINTSSEAARRKPGQKEQNQNTDRILNWSASTGNPVVAMVLSSDVLFAASTSKPWQEKIKPGQLVAVNPKSGEVLKEITLNVAPVFDGMAVANKSLIIASQDGRITCLTCR